MPSLIERYRERLPVGESTPVVALGEGSTPLLAAPRLSERLGIELYLKWEGANPTGSFKDRGMTVAMSKALEAGVQSVICASTGNTAASAAAYAARAGLRAVVLQPAGAVAPAKVAQASALGARVRSAGGKVTVTDGPFTETKELIAGFAILEARSKQEAIQMARDFLTVAGDGECELRQIYTASDPGCGDATRTHAELAEQFAKS